MNTDDGLALMRKLLNVFEAAMKEGSPAVARDSAYEALQVLNMLYCSAYNAAASKARQERKAP